MNSKESIILLGQQEQTRLLLLAVFGGTIDIVEAGINTQIDKLLAQTKVKVIIVDCSEMAQKVVSKVRTVFGKSELPIIVSSETPQSASSSLLKAVNGTFCLNQENRAMIKTVKEFQGIERLHDTLKEEHAFTVSTPLNKRVFDVLLSGLGLLILSPLFLLVALAIKLEDKGPAIYFSKRVGSGYRIFNLIKFRSMFTDADQRLASIKDLDMYTDQQENIDLDNCSACKEKSKPCSPLLVMDGKMVCESQYKAYQEQEKGGVFKKFKNDPRVTKVGKFLRNSSIDELPQLINVFLGHMSLVGNRPLPLYEAEQLTADGAVARFMAPAGLTGLWQVTQRGKKVSMEERIELDNQYAKEFSLGMDLKIIMKTFPALLQQENV